ncbi:DEAD/DEAH box helicase [uncultured Tessaracoccus sp.]|uniref:DEAD/DEAH box helicase n=1 Tax=uncultured Tessaracoccus sp. TaxID=905023 RepID=UPI0025FC30E3|nr:DEAD/DEAH box helicase [uncultured Tessaracoccus sp.]
MPNWSWLLSSPEVRAVDHRPARDGVHAPWPAWVSEAMRARCAEHGIARPWSHQAAFAELAYRGRHAAITTSTGSGKSLGYLLPVVAATAEGHLGVPVREGRLRTPEHTALYLAPTKALAHDQARAARDLGPHGWRLTPVDGDSDDAERAFARDHATFVLTNPDMLHHAILPSHRRWSRLLAGLRYVVVDEAHRYQGVFGAHVAQVLRRLRRLAHHHGADPTVLLVSATAPNADAFCGELIGEPRVEVVDEDGAPAPDRTVVLWQPSHGLHQDTANLLGRLVLDGSQTMAFVASRVAAERVALDAREIAGPTVAGYRAGYLPTERRALEAGLHAGTLRGVATTNALELGIDVAGMDAVLVAGYPGRLSTLWQQAGRAGRRGRDALVVLLAREDPLDGFLFDHPETLLRAPVERAVLHPGNPHVFGPHLAAAAQELPLTPEDRRWFGPATVATARALADQRLLRDRGGRWYWTRPDRAVDFISLRSAGPKAFDLVERDTGRVVGTVDEARVDRVAHEGAVYLHQGERFLVEELDRECRQGFVRATRVPYYTQAQSGFEIDVLDELEAHDLHRTRVHVGDVRLTSQVHGYLRRDERTNEVWDQTPLEMPSRTLLTQAVWWTVPADLVEALRWRPLELGAAAHGIEHTAIGLLPAFAPCDRWDIGGVSTALHPDTGLATIFVHDGLPGGAGFARRAYDEAGPWLTATLQRLRQCPCDDGCPACVVSPKCGNANQVLDKARAGQLLALLLDA